MVLQLGLLLHQDLYGDVVRLRQQVDPCRSFSETAPFNSPARSGYRHILILYGNPVNMDPAAAKKCREQKQRQNQKEVMAEP